MKSVADLIAAIESAGVPCAMVAWAPGNAPRLPYSVVVPSERSTFYADDVAYFVLETYTVELYSPISMRDFEAERAVEDAIAGLGLAFSKSYPASVESEELLLVAYDVETSTEIRQQGA